MSDLNEIKGRLKGAVQTRKITNSMYLISASAVKKSLSAIDGASIVSDAVYEAFSDVILYAKDDKASKKYSEPRNDKGKDLIAVLMSDRGLCGTYNNDIASFTAEFLKDHQENFPLIYCFGERGIKYLKSKNIDPDHAEKLGASRSFTEPTERIGKSLCSLYEDGSARSVSVIYYDHTKKGPVCSRLLPAEFDRSATAPEKMYFEPSYKDVLPVIASAYISSSLRKMIINACAGESVRRMEAMQSATDNADEMIAEIENELNIARQLIITNELTEASAVADNLNGC